ncbi:MAG: arsenate reductase ArsC [Promethearchaeota archaeon]|nr:MAG: arsenate reductase ArsC [Candidatus Lokiarchaeota archaeon]
MKKKNLLFICTHNSARSQMAEGLINYLFSDKFEAYSAGTEISIVKPEAIAVMQEIGIDISNHRSKHLREYYGIQFDLVITVCDIAKKVCPVFPGAKKMIHKSFRDPSTAVGREDEKLKIFREVRDEILKWIKTDLVKT